MATNIMMGFITKRPSGIVNSRVILFSFWGQCLCIYFVARGSKHVPKTITEIFVADHIWFINWNRYRSIFLGKILRTLISISQFYKDTDELWIFPTNGFWRLLNFIQVFNLSIAMNGKFDTGSSWVFQLKWM